MCTVLHSLVSFIEMRARCFLRNLLVSLMAGLFSNILIAEVNNLESYAANNLSDSAVQTEQFENQQLSTLNACRTEKSALDRLDCYDRAWIDTEKPTQGAYTSNVVEMGDIWQRAVTNENGRKPDSVNFVMTQGTIDNKDIVILSTPALGHQPPRPILMLSCIDNITRMQVVLMKPIRSTEIDLKLTIEGGAFPVSWFVRENGYVLESSRGLQGIEEIQQILNTKKLQISSSEPQLESLVFSIDGLNDVIKPLRSACHW